jgi:hypothetical protein
LSRLKPTGVVEPIEEEEYGKGESKVNSKKDSHYYV